MRMRVKIKDKNRESLMRKKKHSSSTHGHAKLRARGTLCPSTAPGGLGVFILHFHGLVLKPAMTRVALHTTELR